MPEVEQTKGFTSTAGILQSAEKTKVNEWVEAIQGGQNAFDAGKSVTKEIKKLKGTPEVAKTGTHEFCVGTKNRVFFKVSGAKVVLTACGHT